MWFDVCFGSNFLIHLIFPLTPSFSVTFTQNSIPLILVSISFLLFHPLILSWLSVTPLFLSLSLSLIKYISSLLHTVSGIPSSSSSSSFLLSQFIIFILIKWVMSSMKFDPPLFDSFVLFKLDDRKGEKKRKKEEERERVDIIFMAFHTERNISFNGSQTIGTKDSNQGREREQKIVREERDKKWIAIENCTFNDGWKKVS